MTGMNANQKWTETWLTREAKQVRRPLAASISFGVLSGVLILLQTALLVEVVNALVFDHRTLASLALPVALLPAVFLARAGAQYASRTTGFECASTVRLSVRGRLVRALAGIGPVSLSREHRGELASTVMDGVEALEGYYARYLPQRAVSALLPFIILAVAYPLDWVSGLIFTGTAVFIPLLMTLIGMEARARNQAQWKKLSELSARFLDALSGITTLKAFGAAGREAAVIARISEEHRLATLGVVRIAFVSSLMLELITTVSIALVAITAGFRLLDAHMDFHRAYFILLIAPEFYQPLRTMGLHYHARMSATAAAERIVELLDSGEPESAASPSCPAPASPAGGARELALAGLSFTYPAVDAVSRPAALDGIDLEVSRGEHLAIFGPSGAGKSTLLSLILGFIEPSRGSIRVDGTDLRGFARDAWLASVSWMPQRPTLFSGTVADNIRLGRRDAGMEKIAAAARRAHADEFVELLPDGYDTLVGEGGRALSGGQVQRLALARMFLRDTPVLLFDEPGAHLDAVSEELVYGSIEELARGRTMLVVTHRPEAARLADRIAVIDQGRIEETGTHVELAAAGGAYARMLESFKVAL